MTLMLLDEQIKKILLKNHHLRKYKEDPSIKSHCIRIIHLCVTYGLLTLDENGNIAEFKACKLEDLTNFELLQLIENTIRSKDGMLIDDSLAKLIQSIDYIGQCWYYPKELSKLIFEATEKKHNYRKIKVILNQLAAEGTCLKITNKKRQSMYRIRFTYSSE
jgi:hypothetical protein